MIHYEFEEEDFEEDVYDKIESLHFHIERLPVDSRGLPIVCISVQGDMEISGESCSEGDYRELSN